MEEIYSNWDEVEASAAAADSERTFVGIDFGYINDPTAVIRVTRRHNDLYLDLLEYSAGLQNYDIAKTLKEHHFDRSTETLTATKNNPIGSLSLFLVAGVSNN